MLAGLCLREECIERIIFFTERLYGKLEFINVTNGLCEYLVRGNMAIRRNAMLKAIELPTGVTNLRPRLSNMDGNY